MSLNVVILAAGQGERMYSQTPKVLHTLAGKQLLQHVVDTAQSLDPKNIFVVYGHKGEKIRESFSHEKINWVEQKKQLGTGHALAQVMPHINDEHQILVLYGDVPVISNQTLKNLLESTEQNNIGIISANFANPFGLGRIVRNDVGDFSRIIEHQDATEEQLNINEIYSGIMIGSVGLFNQYLPKLNNQNAQGEYYLPEVINMAASQGNKVHCLITPNPEEVKGINTRNQLIDLERYHQRNKAKALMASGITILDPNRIDIRGELTAESDVIIDINTIFEGNVSLGTNTHIGPNCTIKNSKIADNVIIKANTVIEDAVIDAHCEIGPFARIRHGTHVKQQARIGNFVEVKKSEIGPGSKVSHLSYIGDAELGKDVNVGAGTITCNYDGANKNKTILEDGVFIGSNTQLVAPVTVGKNATIGAGSTITKDAPPDELTLSRNPQQTVTGWTRPKKKGED